MSGLLRGALVKRAKGSNPPPIQAALAAVVAGAATAVVTYRLLRS